MNMQRLRLWVLAVIVSFYFIPAAFAAVTTYDARVFVPLDISNNDKKKFILTMTVDNGGKPVTRDVQVDGIEKWVRTARRANETIPQYHQRLTKERGDASQAKAKLISDTVNTVFADVFAKVGETSAPATYQRRDPETALIGTFGTFSIPSVVEAKKSPFVVKSDFTGETGGGNGGSYRVPSMGGGGGGSMGSKGLMGFNRGLEDDPFMASGFNFLDDPSTIEFGIEDLYVAEFHPTDGMTDEFIFKSMESLLNTNGLPAHYDPQLLTLFLDEPIPDGEILRWAWDDTGLDLFAVHEGLDPEVEAVPEPATLALFGIGLFIGCFYQRKEIVLKIKARSLQLSFLHRN